MLLFLPSPADGTNAAVNWRDYGMSRWQLCTKRYRFCQAMEMAVGGWFWPDSEVTAATRRGSYRSKSRRAGHEAR
jgi:hypothetical protein